MPSVQRSGGWFNCGLVKSYIWKSLPWDVQRRARTHAHTHADEYIESKCVCVCVWTSNSYDMIYMLTAIGLSPGGSNTHLHTNNT